MRRLRVLLADVRGLLGDESYARRTTWRGREVKIANRGPAAVMGRFGGGWERELGIQTGSRGLSGTVIVNLWRGSIRVSPKPGSHR